MADSKSWRCEECGERIGVVTKRGLRCDPLSNTQSYFEGMTAWVTCPLCGHDNPWYFAKELLQQCVLDKGS